MNGDSVSLLLLYGVPLLAVWVLYATGRTQSTRRARRALAVARKEGLMQPASLHPYIDPSLCLGCAVCVDACPEKDVLGMIQGKAQLVTPANCIGHGACREACPQDAITLVLGTKERGVDIPTLSPDFETSQPGIFVAGELGGMGLIRNGIEQGRQALEAIAMRLAELEPCEAELEPEFDVVIVGAGPAGFSASLAAHDRGLRYVTIEQEALGGAVAHYPRGKIVMTAPVELPIYGKVDFRETRKEQLLELWEDVAERTGVQVRYSERVEAIERGAGGEFVVKTTSACLSARCVLLSIGRRGTPRKLGVPGEDRTKVVYRLVDPEQYRGRRVLVVGGGDSALEAACALSELAGTQVTLSYRQDSFARAKSKNRQQVDRASAEGRLEVLLSSQVLEIGRDEVRMRTVEGERRLANDIVIICAGGVLPTAFLESMGVAVETRHGEV